jgi:hypothetical protein
MWGIGRDSNSSFLVLSFVLTITFCLASAGIFKANISIGMAAYATKSEGSSGGDKSDDGGGSKGDDGNSSGGGSDKGGDSSGSGGSGGTAGDNNPTTEEPSTPLPPIEEPPPTVEQPQPPPPPATCEQGSSSPECSNVPEPPPPEPIDCSTNPSDPSCKTTPPEPVDCNTNPNDPSCGPKPPVDCKTNPDDPSCTTPPICKENQLPDKDKCAINIPIDLPPCKPGQTPDKDKCMYVPIPPGPPDCSKTPDDPSCPQPPTCQPAVIGISCPPPTTCPEGSIPTADGKCEKKPHPDDDCLFDPSLSKCKAICDENNFCKCPEGFSMNEDDHCFPNKSCPKGYERHNDDESGKCFPITCPQGQHFDPKVNKCVPICPDGTELLNGKCPTSKTLSLSITAKDPIIRGHEQTITVTVSDKDTNQKISGANVKITVDYVSGFKHICPDKSTDSSGKAECTWKISGNAVPGKFTANVQASKDGYKSASETKSFMVKRASDGGGGGGHTQGTTQQIKYFREFTDMPSNSPLYITYTSMHKDVLNDIIITGEIKNRGTSTANFVQLIATFYNINNQAVGNKNTFTKPSTLQPGQAAPFTMYLSPKDMPLNQIKSVKYHLSWKYVGSSSSTSPSHASKTQLPNTTR